MNIHQFYTTLKSRLTGQVINGALTGCLLESELDKIYQQVKEEMDKEYQIEQGYGG